MKVMFEGKEIELESATDEEMAFDYVTPAPLFKDEKIDLEDTMEFTEEEIEQINNEGEQHE